MNCKKLNDVRGKSFWFIDHFIRSHFYLKEFERKICYKSSRIPVIYGKRTYSGNFSKIIIHCFRAVKSKLLELKSIMNMCVALSCFTKKNLSLYYYLYSKKKSQNRIIIKVLQARKVSYYMKGLFIYLVRNFFYLC